jgi:septum site-determining protein MinC
MASFYLDIGGCHGSIEKGMLYFFAMDPEAKSPATSETLPVSSAFNVDEFLAARLAEADRAEPQLDIDGDTLNKIFKDQSDRHKLKFPDPDKTVVPQVRFKNSDGKLLLFLPTEIEIKAEDGSTHISSNWSDVLEQLQQRLSAADRFWETNTNVYLQAGDRLLDTRHFQELSEIITPNGLILHSIATHRRQTAINAATAGYGVEQGAIDSSLSSSKDNQEDPLYVKMTIRSGAEIVHPGSVIIFGDVNAGGEVIAEGDILVWGKLKGKAHAGAKGNAQAVIMALHMEATQLRIADFIARVDTPTTNFCPEIAYINQQGAPGICIVRAAEYSSLKDT